MDKLTAKSLVLGIAVSVLAGCISMVQQQANNQSTSVATNQVKTEASTSNPQSTANPTPAATPIPTPMASIQPVYVTHNFPSNAGTIEMALVPEGEFIMGSEDGDTDERPTHKVTLSNFYISKYEVTQAQYKKFLDATKRPEPSENWDPDTKGSYPVTNVSWDDASTFCEWAGGRLPTEAEWEKAARGTDARRYPWGNAPEPSCMRVNYMECGGSTKPVGSYPTGVSPYGCFDMAGNVWEWVADWFDDKYYTYTPSNNPPGPRNIMVSGAASKRVFRGGSATFDVRSIPCANRNGADPSSKDGSIGFRLAK